MDLLVFIIIIIIKSL